MGEIKSIKDIARNFKELESEQNKIDFEKKLNVVFDQVELLAQNLSGEELEHGVDIAIAEECVRCLDELKQQGMLDSISEKTQSLVDLMYTVAETGREMLNAREEYADWNEDYSVYDNSFDYYEPSY